MVVRKIAAALLGLLGVASAIGIDFEERHFTYNGFSLPETVVMPAEEVHPSLWFGVDDIAALAAKRNADVTAKDYWEALVGSEYVLAELPAVPVLSDDKKVVHKYYGALTQIAAYNAFLYQVSDDNKAAYFEKAVGALRRGYAGPLYELDPIVKGSAVDEIYQGLWAQNFAAAYDWVQPGLSAEDDAMIRGHLVKHARYMHENLWSWASSPHNHLSKPAWGLGSVALALSDHPEAKAWLERAVAASNANTRYFFSSDGIYREGSHYYLFSFINFVPFLYHYRNTSGYDAFEAFQPAFEWPVLSRNGKGWMPNFEDSFIRPYPSQLVAGAYREATTRLHGSASLAEVLQWNFRNTDYGAFDQSEKRSGYNYTGATWDYAKALIEYLCYEPDIVAMVPDVSPVQFLDSGQSVFRNGWGFNDAKGRTLIFQAVADADNHEHSDHLSFVLEAENQLMSSDSGYTRASYGEAIRKGWYVTPEAHNVVLANGEAPVDTLPNVGPASRARLATPFFSCEIKEAPYANGGKHQRMVAMLGGDDFAIVDRVALPASGKIDVVMHGGRASLDSGESLHRWTYSEDDYGPESGLRQWFWGKGFKTEILEGELTYIKGDYASFPYLKHSRSGEGALGLTFLEPVAKGEGGAEYIYERKSEDRIVVRNERSSVWLVANASDQSIGESNWKTDAFFAHFSLNPSGGSQIGLVEAKYLKVGDVLEMKFNSKVNLALDWNSPEGGLNLYYAASDPVEGVARFAGKVYRLELRDSGRLELR
ncbi:Heparinase II/III-like protein [Verrucomicrobiia bacterium DG1235]|nr:Heparinase II/III-like protein [Verrucomicrobiae bacterium DG1235]